MMNLQLEQENIILDTITSIKESITGLFTSAKDKEKAEKEKKE
jgi:hypothetical protein